jgi:hypothetical protein
VTAVTELTRPAPVVFLVLVRHDVTTIILDKKKIIKGRFMTIRQSIPLHFVVNLKFHPHLSPSAARPSKYSNKNVRLLSGVT